MKRRAIAFVVCGLLIPCLALGGDGTVGSWTNPGKGITQQVYRDLHGVLDALAKGRLSAFEPYSMDPEHTPQTFEMAQRIVRLIPEANREIALIGFPYPDRRAGREPFTLTGPFTVSEPRTIELPEKGAPPFQLEPGIEYFLYIGMANDNQFEPGAPADPVYQMQTLPIPMTVERAVAEIVPLLRRYERREFGWHMHSITPDGERAKQRILKALGEGSSGDASRASSPELR